MASKVIIENEIKEKEIYTSSNVITGNNNYLYYRLKEAMKKSKSIDIIVSFLMESGVKLILEDLREAIDKGVKIRILTGNYLRITQPQALYLLKGSLGDKIDLRFYNNPKKSFHPKAYIFHFENDLGELFVGSSNLSMGALTSSIEWNYRILKENNKADFNEFFKTFEDLFLNHSYIVTEEVMKEYSKQWIRPNFYKYLDKLEDYSKKEIVKEENIKDLYEPKGAQIEALFALNKTREEGNDKALVVAATGIGKTYLSAFDSKNYKRILFVAHREEIIKQAERSFKNVRPSSSTGFFYGNNKDKDKDIIFGLVQTLGRSENLNLDTFERDYFDYIIIDEFHHATANNYQRILDYFTPKFLLGLTATPERLDNQDVFALCDYNTVYEIRLKDAINRGLLVPFKYYGIYDETINYDDIDFKNGRYDKEELEKALMINKRADLVLKHYKKYNSKRALGFCTSKVHAEFMAKYFNENGVMAKAVYTGEQGEFSEKRDIAIENLLKGEISVLFSVDMFNEGLDIPAIDLVMFLRPTESPTIFLQQLGRGLRKYKNKEYLICLDFIGNYKNANIIPYILSGKSYDEYSKSKTKERLISEDDYPEDCQVDFDFKLIDVLEIQEKKQRELYMKINAGNYNLMLNEFNRVYEELGHIPSRVELFTYIDYRIYSGLKRVARINVFRDYMQFLNEQRKLTENQKEILNSRAFDFISMIETTAMSKTYKMPILLAFYNEGNFKMTINDDDIYGSFKRFYENGSNGSDMLKDKGTRNFKTWGKKEYVKLAKINPIKYLAKTHSDFFYINEEGNFSIREDIEKFIKNEEFLKQVKDAIDFRCKEYYKMRFEKNNN